MKKNVYKFKDVLSHLADAFHGLEKKDERACEFSVPEKLYDLIVVAAKKRKSLVREDKAVWVWGAKMRKDAKMKANVILVKSETGYSFEYKILKPLDIEYKDIEWTAQKRMPKHRPYRPGMAVIK